MACLAFGRFKMHAEAGSGVHLNYAAPCFTDRAGNIRRQEIDSSNIQPDGHGCLFGDKRIYGMNFIDRTSVVSGKRVSVRVDLGGGRIINKKRDVVSMSQSN